jgi:hypothetical protein
MIKARHNDGFLQPLEPLALADDVEMQVTVDTEMAVSAIALDRQHFCATIAGR